MKRTKFATATIVILIIVAVAFFAAYLLRPQYYLVIRHGTTDVELARYQISEEDQFAVGFIHSVNKSPFIDLYEVTDGEIKVDATIYYAFGAGVETNYEPSYTMEVLEDGAMVLGNLDRSLPDGVTYIVGAWSDHTLVIGDLLSDYESAIPYIGNWDYSDDLPLTTQGGLQLYSLSGLDGAKTPLHISCCYLFPWE